jgi:hypothetical protein
MRIVRHKGGDVDAKAFVYMQREKQTKTSKQ